MLRDSGDALLRIIDDILDFSRLRLENSKLKTRISSLRTILENVTGMLTPKHAPRDLNSAM